VVHDLQSVQNLSCLIQQRRHSAGRKSLLAFGQLYLAKHFKLKPSSMHVEMAAKLEAIVDRERGHRIAWAAPRNHAKSTLITLTYVLWCICYRRESCIVICSNSDIRARDLLAQIKDELENNALLRNDFPNVCPVLTGRRMGRYRQDHIVIGRPSPLSVVAVGPGKSIRGLRHQQHRPGLIVLDDLESQESAESEEQRDKLKNWFSKTILNLGDTRTNVILLGTIIHYDSLLADYVLREPPLWDCRCYKAVIDWSKRRDLWQQWEQIICKREQWQGESGEAAGRTFFETHRDLMLADTQVLWEPSENYYQLMLLRISGGELSFSSEKQNEPIDGDTAIFQESQFIYWNEQYATERDLLKAFEGKDQFIVGACDPGLGKNTRHGDDTAIVSLLVVPGEGTFVLESDQRRLTPSETVDAIIAKQARWRYALFGVESNHFQVTLAEMVRKKSAEAGLDVTVHPINNRAPKEERIRLIEPGIRNRAIQFNANDRKLIEQLRQFPKARHDDGPDALAMAIETTWTYLHDRKRSEIQFIPIRPLVIGNEDDRRWRTTYYNI